jgi:SAM-dependent methyltransferase
LRREAYDVLAAVEERHWWYRGMRRTALEILRRDGPVGDVLDAGCGTGGWLARLAATSGAGAVVGLDLHPFAVARTAGRGLPVARGSVTALPFAAGSFDTVTSIDVLYHLAVASDREALSEFRRVLRAGGRLLLQLPALDRLRSRHDAEVATRERYTAGRLRARLVEAGFEVLRLSYANSLLLPVALAHRLSERWRPPGPAADLALPSPAVNRAAEAALSLERRWLAHADLPLGLSVLALARRR